MTDVALIQEDLKIEMEGTVTPPPSIESITLLLRVAAESKVKAELSPGEARVLLNYVEGLK